MPLVCFVSMQGPGVFDEVFSGNCSCGAGMELGLHSCYLDAIPFDQGILGRCACLGVCCLWLQVLQHPISLCAILYCQLRSRFCAVQGRAYQTGFARCHGVCMTMLWCAAKVAVLCCAGLEGGCHHVQPNIQVQAGHKHIPG